MKRCATGHEKQAKKGTNRPKTRVKTEKERDTPVDSSIPEEGEACIGSRHVAGDVVSCHEARQVVGSWVKRIVFINHDINLHEGHRKCDSKEHQ